MLLFRLAWKNLMRTGLRMWINAVVIAFSMVIILLLRALYSGLGHQMLTSLKNTEVAGGQYWAKGFDPLDPTTFDNSYATLPSNFAALLDSGKACSILYSSGTLYYNGKVIPVVLRGIEQHQKVLDLPVSALTVPKNGNPFPVLVGKRMRKSMKLENGDTFVIKWRDQNGVFDGTDFTVVTVMDTVNARVDSNVVWLNSTLMQKMLVTPNQASIIVTAEGAFQETGTTVDTSQWTSHTFDDLTVWVKNLVRDKENGGKVLFSLLLFLSCVGIFNSQTLAVFKRRKEIGMLMALGLRRFQIIALFTLEGVITAIIALGLATVFGAPLFYYTATAGIPIAHAEGSGAPIAERLMTHFSPDMVLITIAVIFTLTTVVSWYPTWKISGMTPVNALTGRH